MSLISVLCSFLFSPIIALLDLPFYPSKCLNNCGQPLLSPWGMIFFKDLFSKVCCLGSSMQCTHSSATDQTVVFLQLQTAVMGGKGQINGFWSLFFATDSRTLTICQQEMPSEESSRRSYKRTSNIHFKTWDAMPKKQWLRQVQEE